MPRHIVVMGVSGSGKTTVARRLAAALDAMFIDADDLHPPENIAKMAAGIGLTDEDRWPWLATVAERLAEAEADGRPTVLACSALRRAYRDVLRRRLPSSSVVVVELDADPAVVRSRMASRAHFMPPELLDSQLATLEPLELDEIGIRIDADQPLDAVVAAALAALGRSQA